MKNHASGENSFNVLFIKTSEIEISDLKRFWKDLNWYERDLSIKSALEATGVAQKPIIKDAEIPSDLKKRCEMVLKNVKKLEYLNNKEKPSELSLKISETKIKLGLDNEDEYNIYQICFTKIPNLSNDNLISLNKYLGIEEQVAYLRTQSRSYLDIYLTIFLDSDATSKAMRYAFVNYIRKQENCL